MTLKLNVCFCATRLFARGCLFAALFICSLAYAATPTDAVLEARVTSISERLRCLVCQNQSIAESQADLANDLRRQVREMLAAGKSDADVIEFMVQRYGDFVLYDPPLKMTTVLLWAGPATLMLLGLGGFAWAVRQRRRNTPAASLSEAEHAAARALLNDSPNNENKT